MPSSNFIVHIRRESHELSDITVPYAVEQMMGDLLPKATILEYVLPVENENFAAEVWEWLELDQSYRSGATGTVQTLLTEDDAYRLRDYFVGKREWSTQYISPSVVDEFSGVLESIARWVSRAGVEIYFQQTR